MSAAKHDSEQLDQTTVEHVLGRMPDDAPDEAIVAELEKAGVAATPTQVHQLRMQLLDKGDETRPDTRQPVEWEEHEHTAGPTESVARRLVETAGSSELAKQAVDAVVQDEAARQASAARTAGASPKPADKDTFARQLGYPSYLAFFEQSMPVPAGDDRNWYVTADHDGRWVAWNDQDLNASRRFNSAEEAIAAIRPPSH